MTVRTPGGTGKTAVMLIGTKHFQLCIGDLYYLDREKAVPVTFCLWIYLWGHFMSLGDNILTLH